jgi:uncharacterized protein
MPSFPRHLAARVKELARVYPVVLLTGARQIGKTTLLREHFPEAAFQTLDLPSVAYEAEQNGIGFLSGFSGAPQVVLDEVQYAPALFRSLKYVVDQNRHQMGQFLLTGSQKFVLMQHISESLAGRIAIVEMDTLSSLELIDAMLPTTPPVEEVLWRGGYPELWRMPELQPRDFFSSYVATYLERDVRQLVNVTSLRDFERFLRMCALRTGNLVNLDSLASDVGISGPTARQWLTVLEASNIIHLLPPYFANHGRRLIKTPKLYFRDTGLACFLLGLATQEQMVQSPFLGALWETFVLGQLKRHQMIAPQPAEIYFWRDAHGVEVDFAIWLNGRLQLVETKWSENATSSHALRGMDKVRSYLGELASDRHLYACRTSMNHWHPHDPSVRVVNGFTFREWFAVPEPPTTVLREDPALYIVTRKKAKKKRAKKRGSP